MNRYFLLARAFLIRNGYKRAEWFRKIGYFSHQGGGCYFQPYNFGTEPHLISFGENCYVAADVRFITHDVVALMLRCATGDDSYQERVGTIEVGDNVFIGTGSAVLYDVKIGDNVIVGAGSLVTRDLPDNTVCVGRPAKPIGSFEEYRKRMKRYAKEVPWDQVNESHDVVVQKQLEWFRERGRDARFPD